MITAVSVKNNGDVWAVYKRYKVNDVVVHNGTSYQNVTGINSEPTATSFNWLVLPSGILSIPISIINGNDFYLIKHPQNNIPANALILEANDFIVNGFFDDTTFWGKAQYLGGNVNSDNSWVVMDKIKGLTLI